MFDLWVKGCEEFDTKIYPLEGKGNVGLYKTWNEICDGLNYHPIGITFHVWNGDKHEAFTDYITAYNYYKSEVNN